MLSVIIPTFNRCQYLERSLLTILLQECSQPYEVIVIDTGDDDTETVLSERFSCVQYYKRDNSSNRSMIRNLGAEMALGDILVFIDNDMLVPPGYLEAHCSVHKDKENGVGLALRRYLLKVCWDSVQGYRFLEDFLLMEKWPWIRDPSDPILMQYVTNHTGFDDDWFRCYSHGLSVRKDFFEEAGGFDPNFGEKWGLEDVELGYRLGRMGAKFELLQGVDAYHQHHNTQVEQNLLQMHENWDVFAQKHSSPEIELIHRFEQVYGPVHMMRKLRKANPVDYTLKSCKEDLVLGCYWSIREESPAKKFRLGLCMNTEKERYDAIRIVSAFFTYEIVIQLEILYNALAVGKTVVVEKYNKQSLDDLQKILALLSVEADLRDTGNTFLLEHAKLGKPKLVRITIPEIDQPRERFFFFSLALWLENTTQYLVEIEDSSNREELSNEEYIYTGKDLEQLQAMKERKLKFAPVRHLISEDDLDQLRQSDLDREILVVRNTGYLLKSEEEYPFSQKAAANAFQVVDEQVYRKMLWGLNSPAPESTFLHDGTSLGEKNILVFMMGEYYQEGMNTVLESFSELVVEHPECTLTVITYDYESIAKKAQYLVNKVLWNLMFNKKIREHEVSVARLRVNADELGLTNNVHIISEPLTQDQRGDLYRRSSCVISVSTDLNPAPEIIEAIGFGLPVAVAEQKVSGLVNKTGNRIYTVPSRAVDVSDVLNIPFTADVADYSAWSCSSVDLTNALRSLLGENEFPEPVVNAVDGEKYMQSFVRDYLS